MEENKENILKILLVEDNPGDMVLIRETLREMTNARYKLTHVARMDSACEAVQKKPFDVILLDLNLPDGQGLENISRINALAPGIPIIILTGLKDELVAVEAVRTGAQDYLVKGDIAPDLFWRSMRYAVERKGIEETLQKAKVQAEAATQAKSEFLAHISHEIRTPLNIILGAAHLLSESELNASQKEYVEIFKTSGDALLYLINDLLDISKAEAGKLEVENIPFNLKELLLDIQKFMLVTAEQKRVELFFEIAPDVPEIVVCDPQRLRQVIFNLVGNAVKFTEKGKVSLAVRMNGETGDRGELLFSVRDTGVGIPEDKQHSIFEAFTQSDSSTSRKFGGTGLGLAICLKLVKLMGGTIEVESKPGAGSTFTFSVAYCLPAPGDKPKSTVRKRSFEGVPRKLNLAEPLSILLADDSKDNRLLIKAILNDEAITIDEVEDGGQALEKCKDTRYDIILMDMQMPEVDGYTCTRQIREREMQEGREAVPVVALTAYSRREDRQKCLDAGCTEYLRKPIRKERFLEVIWEFARRKDREKTQETPRTREPVSVTVDPVLKDLIPDYLERKRGEAEDILTLIKAQDFQRIGRIGHGMVGSGASYGFSEISRIGKTIEAAAEKDDRRVVRESVEELTRYLDSVEVVYT